MHLTKRNFNWKCYSEGEKEKLKSLIFGALLLYIYIGL